MNNSVGLDLPRNPAELSYNPAYMHSADLKALDLSSGDLVTIESEDGSITAVVEAEDEVRPGRAQLRFVCSPLSDVAGQGEEGDLVYKLHEIVKSGEFNAAGSLHPMQFNKLPIGFSTLMRLAPRSAPNASVPPHRPHYSPT